MNHKLLALAAAGTMALAGAAYAAETPAVGTPAEVAPVGTTKPVTTQAKATHMATATIAPAVPFKGVAHSFKTGTDNKSVLVENKAGEWFNLTFSGECKALDGAKSVKLSQGTKSPTGRLYVGKKSCKVESFAKAMAPEGTTPVQH